MFWIFPASKNLLNITVDAVIVLVIIIITIILTTGLIVLERLLIHFLKITSSTNITEVIYNSITGQP